MQLSGNAVSEGHVRVGKVLLIVQAALRPFVIEQMNDRYGENWPEMANPLGGSQTKDAQFDVYALLKIIIDQWRELFFSVFSNRSARSVVGAALDVRNRHAHASRPFDDFEALDALSDLATASLSRDTSS
jgi:Swt1-like HEPN